MSRVSQHILDATPKFTKEETLYILKELQIKNTKKLSHRLVLAYIMEQWDGVKFGTYGTHGKMFDYNTLETCLEELNAEI